MRTNKAVSKYGCWIITILVILCSLAFSLPMFYLGISSIYDELALNSRGVVINAAVVATQIWEDSGTERYEVQYQFSVDGDNTAYSYSDRFGRHNLWSLVTREQWEDLQTTQQVAIKYLPGNPCVNRPVHSDPASPLPDLLGAIILGFAPWLILLIVRVYAKKAGNSEATHV
jgi:hypothetical protein